MTADIVLWLDLAEASGGAAAVSYFERTPWPVPPTDATGPAALVVSSLRRPSAQQIQDALAERRLRVDGIVHAHSPAHFNATTVVPAMREIEETLRATCDAHHARSALVVFIAGPSALAFLVGGAINPRACRDVQIFEFDGGRYSLAYELPYPPIPDRARVLFFMSSPAGVPKLALDEEIRSLRLEQSVDTVADRLDIEILSAARPGDVPDLLRRREPGVMHFSGHGETGELLFQDDDGSLRPVMTADLVEIFRLMGGSVRLVVLNACHGESHAKALLAHVDCVVAMHDPVWDTDARRFSTAFYRHLAEGDSVQDTFDKALLAMRLERPAGPAGSRMRDLKPADAGSSAGGEPSKTAGAGSRVRERARPRPTTMIRRAMRLDPCHDWLRHSHHVGVAVESNSMSGEQPSSSAQTLLAEPGGPAMAPGDDTPRWPLPRWIDWAVGFKVVSLSVDAVCLDPGRRHDAPFNTVVRGLIGMRLRDLRCLTRAATCAGCPETSRCDYAAVFDRRLTATESDSEGDEVPPFWLQGLPADRTLARGAQLSIRLHVTGHAVGVLPYLDVACRDALMHVGMRPSASVVNITDLRTLTHEPITKTLRITARTPLRLRGDMSRSRRDCPAVPWFAQLVRSGVRRLDRLRMAFGEPGDRPYLEMPALGDVEVVSGQGDSMRSWRDTRKGVPLTGLMGSAVVGGEGVRRLVPLLRVLTITNVGKATTMGFGDLALEELPDQNRIEEPGSSPRV